jgi:hypothetical protein
MNRLSRAKRSARSVWRWLHCLVRPGYVAHLEDLLKHVEIHGAYRRGGYDQMTTRQKRTFDRIARQPFTWE